jgi:uncharacterized protein YigE (DUF2233 family)
MKLLVIVALCLLLHPSTNVRAVEFSVVESAGNRFTVCRVEVRKERLQLFHRNESGAPFKRFDVLGPWIEARGRKLVFAMNAGMYHPDYSAVGLYIAEGRQESPVNHAEGNGNFFLKPNGIFLVTSGVARVIETSEFPAIKERVELATQSGPLLVRGGKMHPAFNFQSQSRLFRNGVGVPSPDVALFVISEGPVNFHQFATFFRDGLRCPDALFFDGTVSSLHAPVLKRSDFRIDLGPIIGVTESAP